MSGTLTELAISKVQKFEYMFLFYVLNYFKKGDTIQGGGYVLKKTWLYYLPLLLYNIKSIGALQFVKLPG